MSSLKDMYASAKQKLMGGNAQDDFEEEELERDELSSLDVANEAVVPVTRSVSQFERDFADTSSRKPKTHSNGLDSLFSPSAVASETTKKEGPTQPMEPIQQPTSTPTEGRVSAGNSQDFVISAAPKKPTTRQVAVIKPDTFEEAEIVTNTLKTGGLVLIDLRMTEDSLGKRFLDFSFGATSALGGNVDVLENKVYSISTAHGITQGELERVKSEGLI